MDIYDGDTFSGSEVAMCGIFGIVGCKNKERSQSLIEGMKTSMLHRGPDHSGEYSSPGVHMGMNRLAIIDLESGNQPIGNEDQTLWIVYNGEIYNYHELRRDLCEKGHVFKTASDTEVVLHAFEEYGSECLNKLNGMYAFAVWNMREKKLFIARDRLGVKPLYISRVGDGFAFASEVKALLSVVPGGAQPDWTAISNYFSYGYVPTLESPFKNITKFPPGHYAWIDRDGLDVEKYWQPRYCLDDSSIPGNVDLEVQRRLERAVELELTSDVPVGVFLSGGLDSSAVALYAKKYSKSRVHSFSLRFEEETHDESSDAKLVADHLGLDHHELLFTNDSLEGALLRVANNLDEPFADSTVVPLFMLSEFTRNYVKVVLTGWGGDEIFAGYPTYRAHKMARFYRKMPDLISSRLIVHPL